MINWTEIMKRCQKGNPEPTVRITKTEAEWRKILPADVYAITREKATERPFSSELCGLFSEGRYHCRCCDTELFESGEKFESGTGWPSFTQPVDDRAVGYISDETHGMSRVETVCNVCQAHLGHVFPDGPKPSGLRYCINALALQKQS